MPCRSVYQVCDVCHETSIHYCNAPEPPPKSVETDTPVSECCRATWQAARDAWMQELARGGQVLMATKIGNLDHIKRQPSIYDRPAVLPLAPDEAPTKVKTLQPETLETVKKADSATMTKTYGIIATLVLVALGLMNILRPVEILLDTQQSFLMFIYLCSRVLFGVGLLVLGYICANKAFTKGL